MANYRIIGKDPGDWKELQQYVSAILNDCGFKATTEKNIKTVRGTVEVDVYAEKKGVYPTKILCECKYWTASVPKTIIHAFRTVVEDSGASQGIIISKTGFQKGAYEAIKNSNISLLSWKEFQNAFMMDYLYHIIDRNYKKGHELRRKASFIIDIHHQYPFTLNDEQFNEIQLLRDTHADILFFSFRENYEHLDTKEIVIPEVERGMKEGMRDLHLKSNSLKDYFDFIYVKCQEEVVKLDLTLALIETRLNPQNNK